MAIKFVDIEPEDDKPKKGATPKPVEREAAHDTPEPAPADGEPALPGLPHAKSTPKPRGRKKPLK